MLGDFVDRCTSVDVATDEVDQRAGAPDDTRPGPQPGFTDSAGLPVSSVAALVGLDAATRGLAYLRRNHPARFPLLPARARDTRRRRQLAEVTPRLRGASLARRWHALDEAGRERGASDRVPVPVVGCHHACHDHRWYGEAADGRVAAKQQTGDGVTRHLRSSARGRSRDVALGAANQAEGTLAAPRRLDKAGLTVLGAKGYSNGPVPPHRAARNDLPLLTPRRTHQQRQLPAALTRASNQARPISATVNRQLVQQGNLQRHRAKALFGLATRLHAKLAAHTRGLYLNYRAGRPLLALMDLALI
jgi:hypothetical protein